MKNIVANASSLVLGGSFKDIFASLKSLMGSMLMTVIGYLFF